MTRLHLDLHHTDPHARGIMRGKALAHTLGAAYAQYASLFRELGVSERTERAAALATLEAVRSFRPGFAAEIEGVAEGAGVPLEQIAALNARTEVLASGGAAAHECSTVTSLQHGSRTGVQTWDWHVELKNFWHTQHVTGSGATYVGLTEQGVLSKIGMNEHGLGLHFNILGHREDRAEGVPVHVLSAIVLSEASNVAEAIDLIESAPITSSSAFTMLDHTQAVSVEMSPAGVRVIRERDGSVQRTNHFQDPGLAERQKSELYEPDSSERLTLIRERLSARGAPCAEGDLVQLLASGEGEPALTCIPNMSLPFGERWATLATLVTEPATRSLRVLDGTPLDDAKGAWRTFEAR